jgi:hypothetical protein
MLRGLQQCAPYIGIARRLGTAAIVSELLPVGCDEALAFGRRSGAVKLSRTASSVKLQAPISATAKLSCARMKPIVTRNVRSALSTSLK